MRKLLKYKKLNTDITKTFYRDFSYTTMKVDKEKFYKRMVIVGAIFIALIFMIEPVSGNIGNNNSNNTATPVIAPVAATSSSATASNTYTIGQVGNPDYVSEYSASTVCDFYLLDLIYSAPTTELTNGTFYYCLADNITYSTAPANLTTFDPVTGATTPVSVIYTVHIRPGVEWTDYNSTNKDNTYTYSNSVSFNNASGVAFTHTYKTVYNATSGKNQTLSPITMKSEYVQSADFILSWKILQSSAEYSGSYINVVNVLPLNNLTVEYYLSAPSSTFIPYTMETPILPYHIWVSHDYASTGSGIWNETTNTSSTYNSNAYNDWDLGQTAPFGAGNGEYPGLVGTGPFMMNGGYGVTVGKLFTSDYWQVYANPNYFMQYITGNDGFENTICNDAERFTPKISSLRVEIYSNPSAAVSALKDGTIDAIESSLSSEFVSTAQSIPGVSIIDKPSTGYAYFKFNSFSADAPYNITAFREALREASPLGYVQSSICDGEITPGYSTIPEINSAWYDPDVPTYVYNPTLANETISKIPGFTFKSGEWYYNGTEVTATIQSPSESLIPQIFTGYETIASDWDSIGIKTTIESESFSTEITHLDAYGKTGASPSASYNVITLGVSGLLGDVIGDEVVDFNYTASVGTGEYEGPFSSLSITTVTSTCNELFNVTPGLKTGTQINSLMLNLTNFASVNASVKDDELAVLYMQYIEDEESTMMPIGYGPLDHIAVNNDTFTGVVLQSDDMNEFWYYNEMSVHLRSVPVTVKVPTQKALVTAVVSETNLTDGLYGNVTFTAIDNKTGDPIVNATITVGENPSLLPLNSSLEVNYSGLTGTTNSAGVFVYHFKVSDTNIVLNTPGYSGNVNISAVVTPTNTLIAAGTGSVLISDYPYPVAFSFTQLTPLNGTYQYFNMSIYNPITGKPVSGYSYTIQVAQAVAILKNTTSEQKISIVNAYSAICDYTELSIPVNSTYNDTNVQSLSGFTNSTGNISIMIEANSTFNYSLNGDNYSTYIYIGDYALAAPVGGLPPYAVIGEVTSSSNINGYGFVEPVEIPVILEKTTNDYKISVTSNHKVMSYNGVSELTFYVINNGKAVSGYTLNVTSQNAEGANRGYFLSSTSVAVNPNSYLLTTCGPDTGSAYLPMITLHTNSNGYAYANFTSGFYTINTTKMVLTSEPFPSSSYIPYDQFIISVSGDGAPAEAAYSVASNQSTYYKATFTETGLPSGATWYVNLTNGLSLKSTTSTISVLLANGTYKYTVTTSDKGYKYTGTSSLTVNGKNITETATFKKVVNYTDYYIIGGVVAAIVVIGLGAYFYTKRKKVSK